MILLEGIWKRTAAHAEYKRLHCIDLWGMSVINTIMSDMTYLYQTYSSVAQLAEHSAVNRRVSGSNPGGGAEW